MNKKTTTAGHSCALLVDAIKPKSEGEGRTDIVMLPQGLQLAKLRQRIINMDNLAAEGQGAFEKADVVFCTLGTTRGKAGSAQEFVRVDFLPLWTSVFGRGASECFYPHHFANNILHILKMLRLQAPSP